MVPNTSDDLPDPETPVNTVSRRLGIATLTSFRLFSRAPWTRIRSWLSAGCRPEEAISRSCHRVSTAGEEPVRRPLRHLVAYGSTNRYRPVNRSKASGSSGEWVTQGGGIPPPRARATKLAMTVTVKAMDTQRWICRIHLFQFNGTASEDEAEAVRAHPAASWEPREQVDELPTHHLPAVARAAEVLPL